MPSLPPHDTTPSPRPSVGDALKTAVTGRAGPWAGIAVAIVMAVAGHLQSNASSDDTARVSYESLRAASEANTAAIEALRKGLAEQAVWIQKVSDRLDLRQQASEKASRKPKPVPLPPPPAPPPPPPPPEAPVPTRLLPFDALKAAP